jgi:type II secretory pathway pseudopilin PulG
MASHKKLTGFTVVEVMIVLSIAGMILLVVFLAVPSLQRSSRNTQRKADAANVLSLVTEFASNHSGALPGELCISGKVVTAASSTDGSCSGDPITTNISGPTSAVQLLSYTSLIFPALDTVKIVTNATCSGNSLQSGNSTRQFVAYFGLEPAVVAQCLAP